MGVGKRSILMFLFITMTFLFVFNVFIPSNIPALERSLVLLLTAVNLGLGFTFASSKGATDTPPTNRSCYAYIIIFASVGSIVPILHGYESTAILAPSLVFIGQLLAIWYFGFIRDPAEDLMKSGIHLSAEGLLSLLPTPPSDTTDTWSNLRNKKIASIDLTPLSSFLGLKVLDLSRNRLSEIDLSPLSFCTSLEKLNLWNNRLETLDLSPLKSCLHLRELNLMDNKLTYIDLEPLCHCKEFEYLELFGNHLTAVDLEPLSACEKFNALNVDGEMEELDLTPLSSCPLLKVLTIHSRVLKELDLTPLGNCNELDFFMIDGPKLTLDITPLFNCSNLTKFQVDTVELVAEESTKNREWPKGLVKYRKRVQFY